MINLEEVSRRAYIWHEHDSAPLDFLLDHLNHDLGGTLGLILSDYPEITQIQYEIIKLKVYNKLMER